MAIGNTVSSDFRSAFADCHERFRLPPFRCGIVMPIIKAICAYAKSTKSRVLSIFFFFLRCMYTAIKAVFRVWFDFLRPIQQFFKLCWDGSSCVEQVLSNDKCVLLKDTTQ